MPTPTLESVTLELRETMLDMLAQALAGVQGRPMGTSTATPEDEDEAWTARDPKVQPEHLAMIAEKTVAELSQQTDELGQPLWTPDEVALEVKARQEAAKYPYRHLTYTIGIPNPEDQIRKADQVAKRVAAKAQPQTIPGEWQAIEVDDQGMPMHPPNPARLPTPERPRINGQQMQGLADMLRATGGKAGY